MLAQQVQHETATFWVLPNEYVSHPSLCALDAGLAHAVAQCYWHLADVHAPWLAPKYDILASYQLKLHRVMAGCFLLTDSQCWRAGMQLQTPLMMARQFRHAKVAEMLLHVGNGEAAVL